MNVTILGVDHEFQHNDRTGDFGKLVSAHLDKASVDFIAEEAKETDCTAAQRIASEMSIHWVGMDASRDDRIRLGIFDELMNRPAPLIFEGDLCVGRKGQYLPHADGIREKLWGSRILAHRAKAALVICGLLHMGHLADRLTAQGSVVTQIDVCAAAWYREHYGETKLFRDCHGNLWYEHRYKNPVPIFPQ